MASTTCSMTTGVLQRGLSFSQATESGTGRHRFPSQNPAGLVPFRAEMLRTVERHGFSGQNSQVGTSQTSVRMQSMQFSGRPSGSRNRSAVARAVTNPVATFFSRFTNSEEKRNKLKEELLAALEGLERGAAASEEEKAEIDALASQLEAVTPNAKSLSSPAVNGKWKLLYTTSASILGTQRPKATRPNGPIFQYIDAEQLRAKNVETWPFFNQVTANLTPESPSKVRVQFDTFKIFGLVPVKAPPSARGFLDITYVDDDMRISRGDKGNLFILQQQDNSARL